MELYRWQRPAESNSCCKPWRMVVDRPKLHNHWLSRTLRARDNGAADEADFGRQSLRLSQPAWLIRRAVIIV
jgi:hypothetical protein